MSELLPVTVVTGFLGAGKTTLVNHWLGQVDRGDIAVIVNEHGAIGIDGQLLAARAKQLLEIAGGCVCCTTFGELVDALDALAHSEPRPARILIETSGAASPAGVLRAIAAGGKSGVLTLDGVITVVDAQRLETCFEQDLALEQLGYADVVVLTRAEAISTEVMTRATSAIVGQNGAALVARATRGAVVFPAVDSMSQLLALRQTDLSTIRLTAPPRPHPVYESVSLEVEGSVDGDRFAEFVESEVAQFAGRIFRIKAILSVIGLEVRMIVQGVADSVEISFGEPWGDAPRHSRLVIVGFGLDREQLREGFDLCTPTAEDCTV